MSALFLLGACRATPEPGGSEATGTRDGVLDAEDEHEDAWRDAWMERSLASADLQAPDEGATLLYERVGVYDDTTLVDESVVGKLSVDERTRAARPYRHLHEDRLYEEVTWSAFHENGTSEHGHRVWRRDNLHPAADPLTLPEHQPAPPQLGEGVKALLDTPWKDGEVHFVTIRLRAFPEWDVPLRARPSHVGDDMAVAIDAAREQRLAERRSLYDARTKDLFATIESLGGAVDFAPRTSGYATLRVTRDALVFLAARDDLGSIALEDAPGEPGWHLGEGLVDHRVDGGDFIDAGYDGSGPSTGNAIRVGFIEGGRFRNRACAFKDGANCVGPSRVAKMWSCWQEANPAMTPYCIEIPTSSEFPQALGESGNHGTSVVSAAVADYTENQCEGESCGDTTTSHTDTWETRASGFARDASIYYYGNVTGEVEYVRPPPAR